MASYLIHRLRDAARQQFRWVPHTIGQSTAKPKDYEPGESVQADTPYAAWHAVKDTPSALQLGDILESDSGELRIYKYVGFENVQWQVPEVKPAGEVSPPSSATGTSPNWKA